MNFSEKLGAAVKMKRSCLMLSLDPNPDKFPEGVTKDAAGALAFCVKIMSQTHDLVCGIKIQMAYFEQFGAEGIKAVEMLLKMAKELDLITMVDGKRNDIGATAEAYAKAYLADGPLSTDSLTVNPYLGSDGIIPFVKKCEENNRGLFILVRTSNPSALDFQGGKQEVSLRVAEKVQEWNMSTQSTKNMLSSVGAVIGATVDAQLLEFFREEMPNAWFLCPGVGAQGGSMESVLRVAVNGLGVLIPIGRAVLYAGNDTDYAIKAREKMLEFWNEQQSISEGFAEISNEIDENEEADEYDVELGD